MRWNKFYIFALAVLSVLFSGLFITPENSYAVPVYPGSIVDTIDFSSCFTAGVDSGELYNPLDYDAPSFCSDTYTANFDYYVIEYTLPVTADFFRLNYSPSLDSYFWIYSFLPIHSTDMYSVPVYSDNLFIDWSALFYDYNLSDLSYPIGLFNDDFYFTVYFYEFGSSGSSPSGNIDITENGQYDVTNYATATVNVPAEVIPGDYHDDLVSINNSIIICAAVCLVLYFFYCIYRLIIRNSGVK